jgi:putative ABC transport system permease protein
MIYLNGRPYPLAGVMPPDSTYPPDYDVIAPLAVGLYDEESLRRRDNMMFTGIARLKPDTPLEQVNAAMDTIAVRLEQEHPESRQGLRNRAVVLRDYIVGTSLKTSLLILLGVVGCVLLIACVNVANLLLVRAASRARELAIRSALGAGQFRLIRQMLTESLLLALAGGGIGFLSALWGVDLLKAIAPIQTARLQEVRIDTNVMLFTLVASLVTASICGLIPALQSSRADTQQALKESSRSTGGTRSRVVRSILVVSEVALSLVLLIGAGLMIRSFNQVQQIDPGFRVDRLMTMQLNAPSLRYPNQTQTINFYKNLAARVESAPGVESAAVSSAIPLGGGGFYLGRSFLIEGEPEPPAGPDYQAQWNVVSPRYFSTNGITLLKGRDFDERDSNNSANVIIINKTLAQRMFPDSEPLGKRIRSWRDENQLREIVGIVDDVRYFGRDDDLRGLVYVPHSQSPWRSMVLSVRTHGDPSGSISAIREEIAGLDKDLAVANLETMATVLNRSIALRRASMVLLALFGFTAAVLAIIGIYGVLSYSVAQQRQEIGLRIALGARKGNVLTFIIARGMKLALAGISIGFAGAFAVTWLLEALLYQVSPTDTFTFAAVAVVLAIAALVACYIPAQRAARVDPMVALRYE